MSKQTDILQNARDIAITTLAGIPEQVGESTRVYEGSLQDILAPVIQYPTVRNAFISTLYQKVAHSETILGHFTNPLRMFDNGNLGIFGDTLEVMAFNPAEAMRYDATGADLLHVYTPDVKVEYISVNRKDKYAVSVSRNEIAQAIMNEQGMSDFLSGAQATLTNGDNIDEYNLSKRVFSTALQTGCMRQHIVGKDATPELIARRAANFTKYFTQPDTAFNGYSLKYPDTPWTSWSNSNDVMLVMRMDVMTDMAFDIYAKAFNLDYVTFKNQVREVNYFVDKDGNRDDRILGFVCGRKFVRIKDSVYELDEFSNASNMVMTSWLHHWGIINFSLLENAVAITTEDVVGDTPILSTVSGSSIVSGN